MGEVRDIRAVILRRHATLAGACNTECDGSKDDDGRGPNQNRSVLHLIGVLPVDGSHGHAIHVGNVIAQGRKGVGKERSTRQLEVAGFVGIPRHRDIGRTTGVNGHGDRGGSGVCVVAVDVAADVGGDGSITGVLHGHHEPKAAVHRGGDVLGFKRRDADEREVEVNGAKRRSGGRHGGAEDAPVARDGEGDVGGFRAKVALAVHPFHNALVLVGGFTSNQNDAPLVVGEVVPLAG